MRAEVQELVDARSPLAVQQAQAFCAHSLELGELRALAAGKVLLAQALLHRSEPRSALEAALSAGTLYAEALDHLRQAEAETLAGRIALNLGEFELAETLLRHSTTLSRHEPAPEYQRAYATALNQLAGVQVSNGDTGEALLSLEVALQTWIHLDDKTGQAHCLTNIANIQSSLGQYHLSIDSLNRAYRIYNVDLHDQESEVFILVSLSYSHYLNRDLNLALDIANRALRRISGNPDDIVLSTILLNLGTFYVEDGQYDRAEAHLNGGLAVSRRLGDRTTELSIFDSLGLLYQKTSRPDAARDSYMSALTLATELRYHQGELEARLHLATVELSLGNLVEAHAQVARSLELAIESESPKEEAEAHRILAELGQRHGDYRKAYEHSQEQLRIKDGLFNTERDRHTRNLSIQFEVERARHEANVYRVRTEVEQDARLAAEQLVQERTADLARAHHEVVTRLAMAAEYRDDTTGEHTRRVGRTAARIARGLGWPENQAWILGVAARLHDVGKIGIPDSILLKAGKLTAAEYEHMKSHTLIGSRILSGGRSELLRLAEGIALTHHERWDGSGYPRGLRREQIPLTGRIVALADVFDALTQARPYKRAWTTEEALTEIAAQAGSHFDPEIVEVALRVLAGDGPTALREDVLLDEEDATHILSVFEQLLVERTRDVEETRRAGEHPAQTQEPLVLPSV